MNRFAFKKNFAPLWLASCFLALVTVLSLTAPNSSICLAWLVIGLIVAALVYGFLTSHAKIESGYLRIQADLYWHTVKLEDIVQIRKINLKLEPTLHAGFRTWGTSLPTYNTGEFTLNNDQKGFLFVSNDQHVVHIQTKHDMNILLSLENPKEFIEALNQKLERLQAKLEERGQSNEF